MVSGRYYLATGVHACLEDDAIIILDMVSDRYLQLDRQQAAWYLEMVNCSPGERLQGETSDFAGHLCRIGLITRTPGKPLLPDIHPPARSSLIDTYPPGPAKADPALVPVLAAAALACRPYRHSADRRVRSAVAAVGRWKARRPSRQHAETSRLRHLVAQFHHLAPWFLTTNNACFFTSLVLLRFLSSRGIPADWVFGVRLVPFDAHCWVSHEGILLNETRDKAAEYNVILKL